MKLKPIYVLGDKAFITLTKGLFTEIDKCDLPKVGGYNWCATKSSKTFYAVRRTSNNKKSIWMHREIVGANKCNDVDHKNNNGLYNVRSNLRECTHRQNTYNQQKSKNKSSTYKGVYFKKSAKKFAVMIAIDTKRTHIGYFNDEVSAAKAYDKAAIKYQGEFARLNFPQS